MGKRLFFHVMGFVAGGLMGLGVGLAHEEPPPAPSVQRSLQSHASAQGCLAPAAVSPAPASLAEIRKAVREELEARLSTRSPESDASVREDAAASRQAEVRQAGAYDTANQLIHRAIGYGTWHPEDRARLRGVLHELSVPQQDQLIGELFGAIQSGRLRLDGSGPPL